MKNLILILSLVLGSLAVKAQEKTENANLNPSQVPVAVKTIFDTEHPGISAIWKADGENLKVSYNDPESKLGRIIVYDKEGKVVRVENEVDNMKYPNAIGEFYNKNYPGEKYQVWSAEDKTDGETNYYSGRNMETIWFDKDGNKLPERKVKVVEKKK